MLKKSSIPQLGKQMVDRIELILYPRGPSVTVQSV